MFLGTPDAWEAPRKCSYMHQPVLGNFEVTESIATQQALQFLNPL